MQQTMVKHRSVARTIPAQSVIEGGGVQVHRAFPTGALDGLDPFLLLDEMGPIEIRPGKATGFPDHPHRGFETVTYMLEGEIEHRDSYGHHGIIGPGDVQWMTAGSGLVHSEMPSDALVRDGGRLHGFQLWVNLPRRVKMSAPRYQELTADRIPVARSETGDVEARIIAGEALGKSGRIETTVPITYIHFTLQPGARHLQPVPERSNVFTYSEGTLTIYSRDAAAVLLENSGDKPLDVILVAGEPLGEPVARWGPFVMNTREEIQQAFEDFRAGRLGTIPR